MKTKIVFGVKNQSKKTIEPFCYECNEGHILQYNLLFLEMVQKIMECLEIEFYEKKKEDMSVFVNAIIKDGKSSLYHAEWPLILFSNQPNLKAIFVQPVSKMII